jgi:WD40 repeat protein
VSDNPASKVEALMDGQQTRVSPNGKIIAYISNQYELMLLNRDSGTKRHLASLGSLVLNPAWSPDGRALAYMSLRDGSADIWMISVDGSVNKRLTNDPSNDFQPCWHPDGVHLVWVSDRDGVESLYCMSTIDGKTDRLTHEPVEVPAISPDGRLIAFVARIRVGRSLRLHRLTDRRRLGPLVWKLDGRETPWALYRPRFSPDGDWLGFEAPVEPAGGDIFVVPVNDPGGSPPARLTALPTPSFTGSWWDWIDANRLVVSYYPIQARLLLLRDADLWFERAQVGKTAPAP